MNIEAALKEAMTIDGALGASLVDWESGMSLGGVGPEGEPRARPSQPQADRERDQPLTFLTTDPAITHPEMFTTTMPASRRGHRP
jgi:hypothetical protein